MNSISLNPLLQSAIKAALIAGKEILKVYESTIEVEYKEDRSPLTQADKKGNDAITEILKETNIPILSEEGKQRDYEERREWEHLWVVDPLDGTKEFIKRNGEFTVNIALVKEQLPIMGVIYVPVEKSLYFASEEIGAYKIQLDYTDNRGLEDWMKEAHKLPKETNRDFVMVGSRSHMSTETVEYFNKIKEKHPQAQVLSRGSSLKICMVAEGSADVYPRFAPTMEWDTCAGHAIARGAGFDILHIDEKEPLKYNKEDLLNPWFIVKRKA